MQALLSKTEINKCQFSLAAANKICGDRADEIVAWLWDAAPFKFTDLLFRKLLLKYRNCDPAQFTQILNEVGAMPVNKPKYKPSTKAIFGDF